MNDAILVLQTTLPGTLNEALVGDWCNEMIRLGLAACLKVNKVDSIYRWNGETVSNPEWAIQVKTSLASKSNLVEWLKENHPNEVPEIICWQASAEQEYGLWIGELDPE
ncbi:MAG: divalent cation tolerance protein CutA [Candidatus Thermoplasmatota archaeon]|jgi:periplasmic divalent cation tolerance protein|nr:divalent cation tolerance protein CutA [Candidatus Thalassarchaeaceae archaeon]MEC7665397.1 divalent cation tolerance protein CutA [Candidatus Thermoplasmatota archaeon]MEC8044820.1 divalent cation tolerance protein CutA [Candidatus Thermoplasmatota archaeon]MED5303413.1 divalent cation tolerance protein CutA [Candidatus Thermoplasmatota archaeon]|tara:strand:- start:3022 stop:3348 length:327 start_codon:yes stop_codon:yes gene_type:complete